MANLEDIVNCLAFLAVSACWYTWLRLKMRYLQMNLGVHSESPILGQTQIPYIYILYFLYNIYIYIYIHI